jgi:hypothetical protein
MAGQPEHTAMLVVRVWVEAGPPAGVRARVTHTIGLSAPESRVLVVDSVGVVTRIVRSWLQSFTHLADVECPDNQDGDAE